MGALSTHSDLLLVFQVIKPFRRKALGILALVLLDTMLAGFGVGLVFPVFQALLDPQHNSDFLRSIAPFLSGMEPNDRLILIALAITLLFAAKAGITILASIASNNFLQTLRFHWVGRIGGNYLLGPYRSLAGRKQGELLNDWFNETLSASRCLQSYLAVFSSGALAIVLVILGFVVNAQAMSAMLVAGFTLVFLARGYLYGGASRLSKRKLKVNQEVSTSMAEDLANARDLKLMLAEPVRLKQLANHCAELKRIFLRTALLGELPRVMGEFLAVSALMAFVVIGVAVMNTPPQGMLPMLAFFFIAFYRLVSAVSVVMTSRVKALGEIQSLRHVHEISSLNVEREDIESGMPLPCIDSDIRFVDVGFGYYNGTRILNDTNIVIPYGKITLLVGPSGAGKSTLLDLLMRLSEPDCGHIEIAHGKASEFRLSEWRRCFGYVSQDAALFNGSIRMNLQLAKPDATDTEIIEACRLAGADTFVDAMPEGLDTVVGDRGRCLSGGQRKRIAIARAIICRPSVLILDEATTSFEQSLEIELLERLRREAPGLTIIQVTHRLHSTGNAEWVIVMDMGQTVASGTWQEVSDLTDSLAIKQDFNQV